MLSLDINSLQKKRAKILVVDSEPKVCELIALLLQDSGFKIVERQNFEDLERVIEGEKPDLIIIDPSMKEGRYESGFYKILMDAVVKKNLKFLLLGPPECRNYYEELKIEGLVDYFVKPFSPRALNGEIHNLLNWELDDDAR